VFESMGWPEVIGALFFIAGILVPIWIAIGAKPLGPFPYRWGTYNGIEIALTAAALLAFAVSAWRGNAVAGGSILVSMGILGALGAVGTLRRKRWGAMVTIVMLALLAVVPFFNVFNYTPQTQQPWQAIPILIVLVVNVFYFKKRWKALG
jgi:hypothetical protein